jgi:DNA-binding NtrC family response regulator
MHVFKARLNPAQWGEVIRDSGMEPSSVPQDKPDRPIILVVDDEPVVLQSATTILSRAGYEVFAALDGEAALQFYAAHHGPLHLLLVDVMMPGLNGPALVTRIQERYPELRYLYMSGFPQAELIEQGMKLDAIVIQKPFMPSTLRRRVREVLDLPPQAASCSAS